VLQAKRYLNPSLTLGLKPSSVILKVIVGHIKTVIVESNGS